MADVPDEPKPTKCNLRDIETVELVEAPKSTEASTSPDATPKPSWNHYLGTYSSIFPEQLDLIKSDLTDGDALRDELVGVLDVADNLTLVYKNFVDHMKKEGPRSFPGGDKDVDREALFKEKLLNVLRDNVEYFSGRRSWQSGATCFADWTEEECKRHC